MPFVTMLAAQMLRMTTQLDATLALGLSSKMPREKLGIFHALTHFGVW